MIYINGKSAVYKNSAGTLTTTSINYTGQNQQPVAYINLAKTIDLTGTASRVFVNGDPLAHENSVISKSTGDEPGDGGGIYSGTINGKAEFMTSSPNVFIEGFAAVRSGDLMVSNNRNTNLAPLIQEENVTTEEAITAQSQALESSPEDTLMDWHVNHSETFVCLV